MTGRRCREEVDGSGAVMAEREADLAIVVRHSRGRGRLGAPPNSRRAPRRKRKQVVVPGEQRGLQQDRKNAKKRRPATRSRRPRLAGPDPCGEAQTHVSSNAPRWHHGLTIQYNTFSRCKAFPIPKSIERKEAR